MLFSAGACETHLDWCGSYDAGVERVKRLYTVNAVTRWPSIRACCSIGNVPSADASHSLGPQTYQGRKRGGVS